MKTTRWSAILQNQVVAMVLMMLFVVPVLFAAPRAQRADQVVVLGFLGLLMVVGWALRAQGGVSLEKVRTFLTSGPNLPIILYTVWNGISALTSTEPAQSRWAMVQLCFGVVLYAVVVYQFRHKEQVRALLASVMAIAVVAVLAGLALQRGQVGRLAGFAKDSQLFGAFLLLLLPVTLGVAAGTRNKVWKLAAQMGAVLVIGGLLMTNTRSSWLGSIVAVCSFGLLSLVYAWKLKGLQGRKHEMILAPVLVLVGLVLFVSFSPMGPDFQKRLLSMTSFQAMQQDDSVKDRTDLFAVGFKTIAHAPLTGFGPGAYGFAQAAFNPNSRPLAVIRAWGTSLFDSPHNLYIQIAGELGWVGLALYLSIIIAFLATGIRALGKMENGLRKYTLIGCLAAVLGASVDAIANPGYVFAEVTTFFWVVMAIGMCAAGLAQRIPETVAEVEETNRPAVPNFMTRGLRTAAIGCAAVWAGAILWSLHSATAAAAGGPPVPAGRGNGGPTPTYSGLVTKIDVDVVDDTIPPPAAFHVNDFEMYCNRALEFHVFAISDPDNLGLDDQSANVTFEKQAFRFKLEGLKGKIFFTKAFNNPRFYYLPAKASCGHSGTLRIFYKTKNPKETFETDIFITVDGKAPPNI